MVRVGTDEPLCQNNKEKRINAITGTSATLRKVVLIFDISFMLFIISDG